MRAEAPSLADGLDNPYLHPATGVRAPRQGTLDMAVTGRRNVLLEVGAESTDR